MKKMYLFCLEGIIYAIDEDGRSRYSSVLYGFTGRSREIQEEFLVKGFKEISERYESKFNVTKVESESEKEDLILIIKKLGEYCKLNYPDTGDDKYWRIAEALVKRPSFDNYNKKIWQKIAQIPSM